MKLQNSKTCEFYKIRNLEYLPLFYLIPQTLLKDFKSLIDIPRNPMKVVIDEHWRNVLESDLFILAVKDNSAFFIWSAFGINPYIHCFSAHDPIFQIAYMSDIWVDALEEVNLSIKGLLKLQRNIELPWFSIEEISKIFYILGTYAIEKHNLQPIIDFVKQNRCHEDYNARMSNPKIDFYRKWNHSRAKTKVVSLDAMIENENSQSVSSSEEYYDILDQVIDYNKISFEHNSVYKMDLERYMDSLSETDKEIFQLKYNGYTQKEIAKKLGYKTHSAVGKKINGSIRNGYMNYFSWEHGLK